MVRLEVSPLQLSARLSEYAMSLHVLILRFPGGRIVASSLRLHVIVERCGNVVVWLSASVATACCGIRVRDGHSPRPRTPYGGDSVWWVSVIVLGVCLRID